MQKRTDEWNETKHAKLKNADIRNAPANVTLETILGPPVSRDTAMRLIRQDWNTYQTFLDFPADYQEKLLEFLQGQRGIQIMYDNFFKYIMNPDRHPERLESLLSSLLGQRVRIRQVLTPEGNRLARHGSLVIMDVIVELEDGTIVDTEIQKVGYSFAGERSSCYVSDMIMRQYNRVHRQTGRDFSYNQLKPVYLIILMEQSPEQFRRVSPHFIHHRISYYDTGVELADLEKITYVSLDVFHSVVQNIDTELKAWLTFLSAEEPERIIRLIKRYPKFLACYQDITDFRTDPKELISMFSEALYIMDRNMELYMIDEQKKEIDQQRIQIDQQKQAINQQKQAIDQQKQAIDQQEQQLDEYKKLLKECNDSIAEQNNIITELKAKLAEYQNQ